MESKHFSKQRNKIDENCQTGQNVFFPNKSVSIHLCATKQRKVNGLHILFSPSPFWWLPQNVFLQSSPYFSHFSKKKNVKEIDFICLQGMFITCSVFLDRTTDTKNREENIRCVWKSNKFPTWQSLFSNLRKIKVLLA